MYKSILVAFDSSAGSAKAAQAAAEMAAQSSAPLCVLYAYEQPTFYNEMLSGAVACSIGGFDPSVFDELIAQQNAKVRASAEAALSSCDFPYEYRVEVGQPAHTIVRVAAELQCDLIVVGSRGMGGIEAFLLGSVSERVAHLAHCSVLIVR